MPPAGLTVAADSFRRLLLADERAEVEALLAQQDPVLLAQLDRLSPLPHLPSLKAPLFLWHSESDGVIPWEHSASLAEATPSGSRLEVSRLLQHTRLVLDPRDWRLIGAIRARPGSGDVDERRVGAAGLA
jgi:pimeloyl-ACP methyl ester carboxylesterase